MATGKKTHVPVGTRPGGRGYGHESVPAGTGTGTGCCPWRVAGAGAGMRFFSRARAYEATIRTDITKDDNGQKKPAYPRAPDLAGAETGMNLCPWARAWAHVAARGGWRARVRA